MKSFSPVALALLAAVGMVSAADVSATECAVSIQKFLAIPFYKV